MQIVNRYDFIDLRNLRCSYKIVGDGLSLAGTEVSLPEVLPGQTALIALPALPLDKLSKTTDSFLEVAFTGKHESLWSKVGDEIAWFQISLTVGSPRDQPILQNSIVRIEKVGQTTLEITSPETS